MPAALEAKRIEDVGRMPEDEVEALRAQAQKCRDIAAGSVTPAARETLRDIARDYDERAEKLLEGRRKK